jgi:hypothetical protein
MSCVLRVWGTDLDIDTLLATLPLTPQNVFRKGEPRFKRKPEGRLSSGSGANFDVSAAGFPQLDRQVTDATHFLAANREPLQQLREFPGVDGVTLDFAAEIDPERFPCSFAFPNALLVLAAALGISLELSIYPTD